MSTRHPEIFARLAAEFSGDEVKTRAGGQGRKLQYITAPTVANRLDEVIGPENWDFELTPWGQDALIGTLVVRLPDGTVVRKSNVGGKADMQAGDDDAKSAASDCLKRCAVLLGVGRYLYRDGLPRYVADALGHGPPAPARNGTPPARRDEPRNDGPPAALDDRLPTTGKALWAWLSKKGEEDGQNYVARAVSWAKKHELPERFVDFTPTQVAQVVDRMLQASPPRTAPAGKGDAYEGDIQH